MRFHMSNNGRRYAVCIHRLREPIMVRWNLWQTWHIPWRRKIIRIQHSIHWRVVKSCRQRTRDLWCLDWNNQVDHWLKSRLHTEVRLQSADKTPWHTEIKNRHQYLFNYVIIYLRWLFTYDIDKLYDILIVSCKHFLEQFYSSTFSLFTKYLIYLIINFKINR